MLAYATPQSLQALAALGCVGSFFTISRYTSIASSNRPFPIHSSPTSSKSSAVFASSPPLRTALRASSAHSAVSCTPSPLFFNPIQSSPFSHTTPSNLLCILTLKAADAAQTVRAHAYNPLFRSPSSAQDRTRGRQTSPQVRRAASYSLGIPQPPRVADRQTVCMSNM